MAKQSKDYKAELQHKYGETHKEEIKEYSQKYRE